jgi:hypothetical protein
VGSGARGGGWAAGGRVGRAARPPRGAPRARQIAAPRASPRAFTCLRRLPENRAGGPTAGTPFSVGGVDLATRRNRALTGHKTPRAIRNGVEFALPWLSPVTLQQSPTNWRAMTRGARASARVRPYAFVCVCVCTNPVPHGGTPERRDAPSAGAQPSRPPASGLDAPAQPRTAAARTTAALQGRVFAAGAHGLQLLVCLPFWLAGDGRAFSPAPPATPALQHPQQVALPRFVQPLELKRRRSPSGSKRNLKIRPQTLSGSTKHRAKWAAAGAPIGSSWGGGGPTRRLECAGSWRAAARGCVPAVGTWASQIGAGY